MFGFGTLHPGCSSDSGRVRVGLGIKPEQMFVYEQQQQPEPLAEGILKMGIDALLKMSERAAFPLFGKIFAKCEHFIRHCKLFRVRIRKA